MISSDEKGNRFIKLSVIISFSYRNKRRIEIIIRNNYRQVCQKDKKGNYNFRIIS